MDDIQIITRAEAKASGLRHYFTGKPCPAGHLSPRFTSVGTCVACGREKAMAKHVHTTDKRRAYNNLESFIATASKLHNNLYDYSKAVYGGAHSKLTILCAQHGPFEQSPTNHVQGKGCPKCATLRMPQCQPKAFSQFVSEARAVWGELFDYTDAVYDGASALMTFRCVKHNTVVQQTPTGHLHGRNPCPKCNHMKSAGEQQVFEFLSNLTKAEPRNRTILKPKELDIYLPERRLAVEYCGEFYHSSGSKEEERKTRKKHIEKYLACREQGVRLITLYETEWKERNYAIRRLLRNAVGKSKGKLMARKCELRRATPAEARAFYDRYHPQGGAGSGEHYALFWKGKMVACMRFVLGANDRGAAAKDRVWTLGRYATRITVAGAASRLFKAFVTEFNPPEVKSFSDNRFFDGGMYAQLGFVLEEEVQEDYVVWSPKIGIRPKPHYQRRLLPKRLEEHGVAEQFNPETDPRTEAEMTYLMGARRLYDCGKKRWLWTRPA